MTKLRWLLLGGVAASLLAAGCVLTSAQILVSFAFPPPNPFIVDTSQINGFSVIPSVYVDLNTESDYEDNKDKLKDIEDLAVLGAVTNQGAAAIGVEVWITRSNTGPLEAGAIQSQGTLLWGPFNLGVSETRRIGWDQSAALFKPGKQVLIDEVKGDGEFSLYLVGAGGGSYKFAVQDGFLVLVLGAGL